MKRSMKYLIAIWIVAILLAVGLLISAVRSIDSKKETTNRMKVVERGAGYKIMVDTNTGICYLSTDGGVTVMYDHEGVPYIENGWRDYD